MMGESIYISIFKKRLLIYIFLKKFYGGLEGWGWRWRGMGMGFGWEWEWEWDLEGWGMIRITWIF